MKMDLGTIEAGITVATAGAMPAWIRWVADGDIVLKAIVEVIVLVTAVLVLVREWRRRNRL